MTTWYAESQVNGIEVEHYFVADESEAIALCRCEGWSNLTETPNLDIPEPRTIVLEGDHG